jgi:hypothetical protein
VVKSNAKLIWIAIKELHFLRRNPQYLSPHAMEALKASIQRDGFLAPVLLRPYKAGGYELLSGNHRVMAAKELGMKAVPAIVSKLNNQQAQRVAVNLNTVHGEPNAELLAPFLAEIDEELLKTIHLDDETIRAVSELDADLAESLAKLEPPESFNNESVKSAIAQCVCRSCGKRHIRGNAGKGDGLQARKGASKSRPSSDVHRSGVGRKAGKAGRAAVCTSGRKGRRSRGDQHSSGKSVGAVRAARAS